MAMQKKRLILLIIGGIIVLLFIGGLVLDFLPFGIYTSSPKTDYGTIIRRDTSWEEWGLEIEEGEFFKHKKILLISNLPSEFQKAGLKMKCSYNIGDVIGTSNNWSTVINILDIQKTE